MKWSKTFNRLKLSHNIIIYNNRFIKKIFPLNNSIDLPWWQVPPPGLWAQKRLGGRWLLFLRQCIEQAAFPTVCSYPLTGGDHSRTAQIGQRPTNRIFRQLQISRHGRNCRPALPLPVCPVKEIAVDRNGTVRQFGLIEKFQTPNHFYSPPFSAEIYLGVRTCGAGSDSGSVRGYLARMAACNLCLSA